MSKARLGAFVISVILSAACGGSTHTKDAKTASAPAAARTSGSCAWKPGTEPIGRTGAGATLALAKVEGRRVAFIADEDAKAILTVDLDTHAELATTSLNATPGQVYVAKDGRVFATLRDRSELVVLGATKADAPLTTLCAAATPAEPVALAATPDDTRVVVTTGWGRKVAVYETTKLGHQVDVNVPREPRSVVVSDDGRTAFVSHAVGSVMSAIDLASSKTEAREISMRGFLPGEQKQTAMMKQMARFRFAKHDAADGDLDKREEGHQSCQGFALAKSSAVGGRIFAPQVMVEPGDPDQRPDGYGDHNTQTETPAVAVIDEGTASPLSASMTIAQDGFAGMRSNDTRNEKRECLLPRAANVDPSSKTLLVSCFGIDAIVAYDATAARPLHAERRRWIVGSGPTGVVVDTEKHRGVSWAQFDRSISSFDLGTNDLVTDDKAFPVKTTRLSALAAKVPSDYALGRILFHAAGDGRISNDGRACASCHPDGRDDAITWATPDGPRRSIMLAGRVTKTAPYSWNGSETTLHNHLGNTFDRLSGKGLRSIELDALVAYISAMPAPPVAGETLDKAKVERGRQIFASKEAGCASCHSGADFTDGKNHDVGSKVKADRTATFNTPSLHLVGSTGPYFHDGRYTSLNELLVKSDGKMGHTKHLTNGDVDALATYLKTL